MKLKKKLTFGKGKLYVGTISDEGTPADYKFIYDVESFSIQDNVEHKKKSKEDKEDKEDKITM